VKALLATALVIALGASARAQASEHVPVWLGIQYGPGTVGIQIGHVYEDSPAALAGVQVGDEILELAQVQIQPGTLLMPIVENLKVGEHVKLKVLRGANVIALDAVMTPRADGEIVQRRLVGKPAPDVAIALPGGGKVVDLAALDHKVAILAFFPPSCDACASIVSALGPWAQQHDRDPVVVLGATPILDPMGLEAYLRRNPIVVPVGAIAPPEQGTDSPFFADPNATAVTFVVIDGGGIVRLAAIVTPGGEEELDDVCVAAERALKQLRRR
jgi:hypothetical protein